MVGAGSPVEFPAAGDRVLRRTSKIIIALFHDGLSGPEGCHDGAVPDVERASGVDGHGRPGSLRILKSDAAIIRPRKEATAGPWRAGAHQVPSAPSDP